MDYIKSMRGVLTNKSHYGETGYDLAVTVQFDAAQFNRIKKTQCPLAFGMAQIKNVVLDATGVRGFPSYSPLSMRQRFPRAKNGVITLTVYFDVSEYTASELSGIKLKAWSRVHHAIDLQSTLEATRQDGHLFAKTAVASIFGN